MRLYRGLKITITDQQSSHRHTNMFTFQKVSSFQRAALLHTTATFQVSGYNILPAVDRRVLSWAHTQSPDITPSDFTSGYVSTMYNERINDINHLNKKRTAIRHQTSLPMGRTDYRLDVWGTNGAHVEFAEQVCKPGVFLFIW
ncbi:hypothetical protein AVEN_144088-1 [Araneus ventricosus]|uniref:Uncharacterized protein n=1 Tax=Araneus ventricosus TaxID=182803 RepID=A0A4Y2R586_ARAVE|nr:hypothetical protein AVEN_144088-1 [Araneus ventricosus]